MQRFVVIAAMFATVTIAATPDASARDMKAFRHFSRAKFVDICERACSRHGNPKFCCTCNGGIWHSNGRCE